jgi:heme exporter protein CcmD
MAAAHFSFVVTAYSFAGFVLVAMIAWIAIDYRAQQKKLTELEAQRGKK